MRSNSSNPARSQRGASILRLATALACCLLGSAGVARAHVKSLSYSSWELGPTGARIEARLTATDVSLLGLPEAGPSGSDPLAGYLAQHLRLESDGKPCPPDGPPTSASAAEGWVVYDWRVTCPPGDERTITSDLLLPENPAHLHFARARLADRQVVERVLAEAEQRWPLPSATAERSAAGGSGRGEGGAGTSLLGYVALGVKHILGGWDHLAFVLALLLLARSAGEVATLVTAFTVAHSLTLALAVIGVLRPEARAVEAAIGFSIALVAAENSWLLAGRRRGVPVATALLLLAATLWAVRHPSALAPLALVGLALFALCHFALLDRSPHPGRLRAAVAFAFGLVHGFGFAGVLAEMDLPRARLAQALLGFNVGVELGQLAVVAIAWPLLRLIGRLAGGRAERLVMETASAAVCGLGLFWFVTRMID